MIKVISTAHSINNGRLYNLLHALNAITEIKEIECYAVGEFSKAPSDLEKLKLFGRKAPSNYLLRLLYALFAPIKLIRKGDLVVLMNPELIFTALLMRLFFSGKVIVDISEDYRSLLKDRQLNKFNLWLSTQIITLSYFLVKKSDLVTVSNDEAPPTGLMPRLTLKNIQFNMEKELDKKLERLPTAIYVGDIRRTRGAYDLLELARRRGEWKFILIGELAPVDREQIRREIMTVSNIKFMPSMSYSQLIKYISNAWIGLIPLYKTEAFSKTMPAKFYDYISCGTPVLTYEIKCSEMVRNYGVGAVVKGVNEMSKALKEIYLERDSIDSYRENTELLKKKLANHRRNFKLFQNRVLELYQEIDYR
jgi:glycosyltransferase involved in cell wall biosynthesis